MKAVTITIIKDRPIPNRLRNGINWPWATWKVGDSFDIPEGIRDDNVRQSFYDFIKRTPCASRMKVTFRKLNPRDPKPRYGVWRIA